ncbi:MAG: hypothetical protein D6698_16940 [Gammaproteobacteria bacterium]|nr:MAG: hypothetical protein D6698_16940 [Gammaproteobacteria bacterium]
MKETLSFSFGVFKREWKVVLAYFGVMIVVNLLFSGLSSLVDFSKVLVLLVSLIDWLVQLVVQMMGVVVVLALVDGKSLKVAELKDALRAVLDGKMLWSFIGASLLYGLIVLGGLILLVVPGIIWAVAYQFYRYTVVDDRLGAREALRKSKEMTRGNLGFLFLFGLALAVLNVAGVLALVVGLVVTVPVSMLAMASVYRQLSGKEVGASAGGSAVSGGGSVDNRVRVGDRSTATGFSAGGAGQPVPGR